MRARIPSLFRAGAAGATALSVTAVAVVGGVAVHAAAWPTDAESQDAERPAAAPESRAGLVVKDLYPALQAEYLNALEQARIDEAFRAMAEAEAAAAAAAESSSSTSTSSSGSGSTASGDYWAQLRACESGGDYSTNTGNGYYGAYQFDQSTWQSVGGSGLPSDASPEEQDTRAQMLYEQAGSSPWPNCG
jgi:Transglycosylase-like domain